MKRRAPNAHTFQEALRARFGNKAHVVSLAYSLGQQIVYSLNLLINGASIFSNLTGMNNDAAIVLFPIGVIVYTLLGGIKATFLTDWTHTVVIYTLMLAFAFSCYLTNADVGSPGRLWELLNLASENREIIGNRDNSLMTFDSRQSGLFGLVLFGAGWAASVDSQLFQKSIACDIGTPELKFSGLLVSYTLGAMCWFTIPFVLATTLGLACAGLEGTEFFPTASRFMDLQERSAGLVMPYGAYALMGKGGVGMVLTMVFMAVTALFSSETIAVSSLLTYDIYKTYFNPKAKGKELVRVSHLGTLGFGIITIGLGIGLAHAGFDVSFITTVSGIVVNVCVIPMGLTLFWNKMTGINFICSTLISSCIAVAVWVGYTSSQSGDINLVTLSTNEALAAGNTVAIFCPLIFCPIFYFLFKPKEDYDWQSMLHIQRDDNVEFNHEHGLDNVLSQQEATEFAIEENQKNEAFMIKQRNMGVGIACFLVFFYLIIFPLPLYGSHYVFSRQFFVGWVVVMFLWAFFAAGTITLLPIWEGRHSIKQLVLIMFGKQKKYDSELSFIKSRESGFTGRIDEEISLSKEGNVKVNESPASSD